MIRELPIMFLPVECQGEELLLSSERAVYWPREKTLWVADTHFGKAATFRAAGIPIPRGTTVTDLDRLCRLIDLCKAEHLLIFGDLIHSKSGRVDPTFDVIGSWRKSYASLMITLIRGNHDRHAGDPPEEWQIVTVDAPVHKPPFAFYHEPPEADTTAAYAVSGHVHPSIRLRDWDGSSHRFPCYWFGATSALLPSFGSFTGSFTIAPRLGDRAYPISQGDVWLAPAQTATRFFVK